MFIRADYAKKLKCNYSVFVSFAYNPSYVALIKSLKQRAWIPEFSEWEIGQDSYEEFMNLIKQYNILYDEVAFRKTVDSLKKKVAKSNAIRESEVKIDISKVKDLDYKTSPRDYQLEGIAFGLTHDKFLLADTMGLGKSLQCINIARLKRGGKHCLVIVGYKTLLFNWVEEIKKHSNETVYVLGQRMNKKGNLIVGSTEDIISDIDALESIDEFFIVISISSLRHCLKTKYVDKNGKSRVKKDFILADKLEQRCREGLIGRVILDEGQVCRNMTTDQTNALLTLRSAPYKIVATGTPLMNKHIDLYPIMSWLGKTSDNFYSFRDKYCIMGGFQNKQIVGNKNGDMLNQQLSEFMLRRKKEDVLDLPDKIFIDEKLEMGYKQVTLYEQTKKLLKKDLAEARGNKIALLGLLIKLRQITDLPSWVNSKYTESVKFERIIELLNSIVENEQKAIIFSNWETPLLSLMEDPTVKLLNPAYISGSVKDRISEVKKFQEDDSCKVIIGTIGAMGTGLTLTAATNIIFMDEPWNRALKDQCIDRAHRIGTKSNINIYTLICKDSIDETVHKTVMKKGIIQDNVVDGIPLDELQAILEKELDNDKQGEDDDSRN